MKLVVPSVSRVLVAADVATDSGGGIVVLGQVRGFDSASPRSIFVARFGADGSLDPRFGDGGIGAIAVER